MNHYVHNLSPMAIEWGWFILPWYWLAYIAGFFIVYLGLMKFSSAGHIQLSKRTIHDYLSMGFLSLLLGGRFGYILIYNLNYYLEDPAKIFAIWEGGMSFHGAIIGIGLFTLYQSKKQKIPFLRFTDAISIFAPIGIFLGRISNFINGELAGRVTDVAWAVVFPKFYNSEPRHPSQIYEALLEGLVLFLILYFYGRKKINSLGFCTGLFVSLYGVFRFFIEFFRNPDPQIGLYFNAFTMGQILCSLMVLAGLVLIFKSDRKLSL
ncbi:prolipoprotein diacylglyceryl transferase [Halobacteriovorax sp.]|uniref:prolipoprotein diacylglyceryl transferase n=1 Tax=Halobacteriovorax sp. TaxID=2020862 RepID=UPI003566622E